MYKARVQESMIMYSWNWSNHVSFACRNEMLQYKQFRFITLFMFIVFHNLCRHKYMRFNSKVNAEIDTLWTFSSAINDVEWYVQTLIVSQQTEFVMIHFMIWQRDQSCAQYAYHHVKCCNEKMQCVQSVCHFLLHQ